MTTPERSVEDKAITDFFKKVNPHLRSDPHGRCAVESALVKALQAERKKREEAVEAERERILLAATKIISNPVEFMELTVFTQPNNPKV